MKCKIKFLLEFDIFHVFPGSQQNNIEGKDHALSHSFLPANNTHHLLLPVEYPVLHSQTYTPMNDEATSETFKSAMNKNFRLDEEGLYKVDRVDYGRKSKLINLKCQLSIKSIQLRKLISDIF